jgi:hypothetical protein
LIPLQISFLNIVSSSLIHSPDFRLVDDPVCSNIIRSADQLASLDPQFILKVNVDLHLVRPGKNAVVFAMKLTVCFYNSA